MAFDMICLPIVGEVILKHDVLFTMNKHPAAGPCAVPLYLHVLLPRPTWLQYTYSDVPP